ncbi:hypothetical protein [Lapillicoccus jejuensis]|uniref:hypothetical protein n=1 Tax=Lapillicoccus jejuensis TaxID=402171 RepID=UPI001152FF23|nr:hypothetical protein [Lapillicoccus jejuensis]
MAAAAALVVIGYHRLSERSPEAGAASLQLVRELAAVVLVCTKAVEGVVKVLGRSDVFSGPAMTWGSERRGRYDRDDDFDDA